MQRTQFVLYEISSLLLPGQLVCIEWYNVLGTFTSCESPSVSLFLYSIESEPEFN